jgi:hypothetical protein
LCSPSSGAPASPAAANTRSNQNRTKSYKNSTGGVEWTVRRARACLLLGAASGLAALAGQRALLGLLLSLKLGMHLAAPVLVLNLRRQCRLRLLLPALPPAPPLALVARGRRRVGGMLLPPLLLRHRRRGLLQLAQRGFKRRRRRRLGLRYSRENAVSGGKVGGCDCEGAPSVRTGWQICFFFVHLCFEKKIALSFTVVSTNEKNYFVKRIHQPR